MNHTTDLLTRVAVIEIDFQCMAETGRYYILSYSDVAKVPYNMQQFVYCE